MFGKKKRKDERPQDVELPITPFLDMSFQLMAFFIFTFRPMPQEGQMALYLPKTDDVAESNATLPPEVPEDKQDEYKVLVASANGAIGNISVQGPAGVTPIANTGDGRLPNLLEHLKTIAKPKDGKKGPTVKIEAQNDLLYSQLIQLMDVCRKAGFDSVGVGPQSGAPAKD